MRTDSQTAAINLKAWDVRQRNLRRERVRRAFLGLLALIGGLWLLAEFYRPSSEPDEAALREARAADLSRILQTRATASATIRAPLPEFGDDAPAPWPLSPYSPAEMNCLARAVYFESRGEPLEGQIAVAQVVMNRVRSSGGSICQVVYRGAERGEKCQFSFACDPHVQPPEGARAWIQSRWVAEEVAGGRAWLRELDGAEHFHTVHVKPIWRHGLRPVRRIGWHIFYVPLDRSPDMTFARHPRPGWDDPAPMAWVQADEMRLESAAAPPATAVRTPGHRRAPQQAVNRASPQPTFDPFAAADAR